MGPCTLKTNLAEKKASVIFSAVWCQWSVLTEREREKEILARRPQVKGTHHPDGMAADGVVCSLWVKQLLLGSVSSVSGETTSWKRRGTGGKHLLHLHSQCFSWWHFSLWQWPIHSALAHLDEPTSTDQMQLGRLFYSPPDVDVFDEVGGENRIITTAFRSACVCASLVKRHDCLLFLTCLTQRVCREVSRRFPTTRTRHGIRPVFATSSHPINTM